MSRKGRRNRPSNDDEDGEDGDDGNGEAAGSSDGGAQEFRPESGNGGRTGGRLWCLGRTLLVEAKVLINGPKNEKKRQIAKEGGEEEGEEAAWWV